MSDDTKCGYGCKIPLDIWGHACRYCMAKEIERLREQVEWLENEACPHCNGEALLIAAGERNQSLRSRLEEALKHSEWLIDQYDCECIKEVIAKLRGRNHESSTI